MNLLTKVVLSLAIVGAGLGAYYLLTKTDSNVAKDEMKVASQYFLIDSAVDSVLEMESGTFFYIPEGAFIKADGSTPEKVELKISSMASVGEVMASGINLPVAEPPYQLRHATTFKIEAFADGEALQINKDKPIYVEVPKQDNEQKLLYVGEEEGGKIQWKQKQELKKYLIPVDINTLDIYPEGFVEEIKSNLPFRSHTSYSKTLADSLLYSFGAIDLLYDVQRTEKIYTLDYGRDSAVVSLDTIKMQASEEACGLRTSGIKAIINPRFQQTYIATREFERRLKQLYKACTPEALDVYIQNLNQDLWVSDSLVALTLKDETLEKTFRKFSEEKLTNVRDAPLASAKLLKFYSKRVEKIEKELKRVREQYQKELARKEQKAIKVSEEYKELLKKREAYRMDKFGFTLTKMGWYNASYKVYVEDLERIKLEVKVKNREDFERTYAYVFNPNIGSLFSLYAPDKETFDRGYSQDKYLLVRRGSKVLAIAVAYVGEDMFIAVDTLVVTDDMQVELLPEKSTKQELKKLSRGFIRENKLLIDQQYQEAFYKENKRKGKLRKEREFIDGLARLVRPCCYESELDYITD